MNYGTCKVELVGEVVDHEYREKIQQTVDWVEVSFPPGKIDQICLDQHKYDLRGEALPCAASFVDTERGIIKFIHLNITCFEDRIPRIAVRYESPVLTQLREAIGAGCLNRNFKPK